MNDRHSAWSVRLGIRPIRFVGAEVEYFDLGSATLATSPIPFGQFSLYQTYDVKMKGAGVYGLLYLPLPLPLLDVYAKAGVARVDSTLVVTNRCIPSPGLCGVDPPFLFRNSGTDTRAAYGAGAQLKFGSLRVRAEYLRFDAAGAHPSLATLGVGWAF